MREKTEATPKFTTAELMELQQRVPSYPMFTYFRPVDAPVGVSQASHYDAKSDDAHSSTNSNIFPHK